MNAINYLPLAGGLLATGIAQSAPGFDWAPLLNVGGIGVVLAWFLWKLEPRMRNVESAIDRLSRMVLILLIELPNMSNSGKAQAKVLISEIDAATRARGETPPPALNQ